MSARFGRNQRRKMREAHAAELALQAMLLRQSRAALASESEARIREKHARLLIESELFEWAKRILALVGPDSAFALKMAERGIDAALFKEFADYGGPMRSEAHAPISVRAKPTAIQIKEARKLIMLFATTAHVDRDEIAYRQRFMVRGPDGAVALMMDERTLYSLRRDGDAGLVRHLLDGLIGPWMSGKVQERRRA